MRENIYNCPAIQESERKKDKKSEKPEEKKNILQELNLAENVQTIERSMVNFEYTVPKNEDEKNKLREKKQESVKSFLEYFENMKHKHGNIFGKEGDEVSQRVSKLVESSSDRNFINVELEKEIKKIEELIGEKIRLEDKEKADKILKKIAENKSKQGQ